LARPLATLGLFLTDPSAHLFPNDGDRNAIRSLQGNTAFHPGSGSETKNWPIENWIELGNALLARNHSLIVIAGEADTARTQQLKLAWEGKQVRFAENLPLPHLAALLEGAVFLGHDSGISHIAAAVGARCLLLFGRTDPAIWAPANSNVTVLRAPDGKMELLETETVAAALWAALG
jgi:heptosyltransferase-2